jgi:hypothetical protein
MPFLEVRFVCISAYTLGEIFIFFFNLIWETFAKNCWAVQILVKNGRK